ncbi:MAPEG family protein [Mangrovicella endophytica]|uniref:MAPEG family protein n=1 Tax=Mangrovicella endophytica TaxID=2066697 RepID=UPI000C9DC2BC|nr:MAPEG family protein [Mangrovicella endophytica]
MQGNIAIFWPMIVQAALTLCVYPLLTIRRRRVAARGEARFEDIANGHPEPEESRVVSRNIANQYELPVLFFVVCLSLYVTNGASWLAVVLAWIFALSRIVHAVIHLGPNVVIHRGLAFIIGFIVVAVLWIMLALHVLNVGAVVGAPLA